MQSAFVFPNKLTNLPKTESNAATYWFLAVFSVLLWVG